MMNIVASFGMFLGRFWASWEAFGWFLDSLERLWDALCACLRGLGRLLEASEGPLECLLETSWRSLEPFRCS